tara:strand:- start:208 stop:411 length:204 start_codon:yes stop_codon:yes gene_type:complete
MASKKEVSDFLKGLNRKELEYFARPYMSGGGFKPIKQLNKKEIIKVLISGKTSFFNKGGVAKKRKSK